ncbi:MAG: glycerophosphodiester phosphodiesterase family protein [Caldilineaceae bacterium]
MFNRWNVARVSFTSFLLVIAVKVAVFYAPVSAPTLSPVEIASPTTAESSGEMVVYPLANFDVQGHRGARGLKPENTLPAFETALDLGVDTLELDLHLTADDVVVIWHDDTVSADKCRLDPAWVNPNAPDPALAPESERMIRRLTFAQLQEYRCDLNPDEDTFPEQNSDPTALAGDDFRIVSLDQLFAFVEAYTAAAEKDASLRQNAGVVRFNLETKRNPRKPDAIGDDFDGQATAFLNRQWSSRFRRTGWASGDDPELRSPFASYTADQAAAVAPVGVGDRRRMSLPAGQGCTVLSPRQDLVTPSLLSQAHAHGVKVIPWTVNDPNDMHA